MLRSIKQSYGNKLGASDGEIGHIKDFYFDDQNWTIRYLVADTGIWLPGRQVLISPHSLTHSIQWQNSTSVNSNNQPSMESKTLSKLLEESIAECADLKMENEKLRRDLNAAVMYSIQNQRHPLQKPSSPN